MYGGGGEAALDLAGVINVLWSWKKYTERTKNSSKYTVLSLEWWQPGGMAIMALCVNRADKVRLEGKSEAVDDQKALSEGAVPLSIISSPRWVAKSTGFLEPGQGFFFLAVPIWDCGYHISLLMFPGNLEFSWSMCCMSNVWWEEGD